VTAKVSAFNRVDSNGAWSTSYLGAYAHGLGVTNFSEGSGSDNKHVVDNIGGNRDYLLFEFSSSIVADQAFLDYVYNGDSDISVWIGTKPNPTVNHNTLSDAFLTSIGPREDNDTTSSSSRWANINAANRAGNVLVISASASDTTPEDAFKLRKVQFGCCPTITLSPTTLANGKKNTAYNKTITASGSTSPYTFSKISGSLPAGITLSSAGVLSGTPTVSGTFNFTVEAKSTPTGCTGTRAYSWVITN
jgi:hypothetical protein